jgi:hypothetical protein
MAERLGEIRKRGELVIIVLSGTDVFDSTRRVVLVSESIVRDLVRKSGPVRRSSERDPFRS